jgi:hypothetical protein
MCSSKALGSLFHQVVVLGLVVDALFGSIGEVDSLQLKRCDYVAVSYAVAVIAGSCSRVDESAFVVYRLVLSVEVAVMAFAVLAGVSDFLCHLGP